MNEPYIMVINNGRQTQVQRTQKDCLYPLDPYDMGQVRRDGKEPIHDSCGSDREDWTGRFEVRESNGGIIDQLIMITRHQLVCAKNTVQRLEDYLSILESLKNSKNE